eukprot:gene23763-9321_t
MAALVDPRFYGTSSRGHPWKARASVWAMLVSCFSCRPPSSPSASAATHSPATPSPITTQTPINSPPEVQPMSALATAHVENSPPTLEASWRSSSADIPADEQDDLVDQVDLSVKKSYILELFNGSCYDLEGSGSDATIDSCLEESESNASLASCLEAADARASLTSCPKATGSATPLATCLAATDKDASIASGLKATARDAVLASCLEGIESEGSLASCLEGIATIMYCTKSFAEYSTDLYVVCTF